VRALEILRPPTLDDALASLAELGDRGRPLSGGTALNLMYGQGLLDVECFVDLAGLPGLDGIVYEPGDGLRIGALVTHRAVEQSPIVRERLPFIGEVFHKVANVRVRNQATVGGVLAEADYASDPPTALAALDAEVTIRSSAGARTLAVSDLIRGYYDTALEPGELITELRIPDAGTRLRGAYEKYVSRSSEDRPCVCVAGLVDQENGLCRDLRVAVGAVSGRPERFRDIEQTAVGEPLTDGLAREVAAEYAARIEPLSDIRGSAWYRKEILPALVRRTIVRAGGIEAL
jgi:carbon-monoxide dehydrogenase medium subunit